MAELEETIALEAELSKRGTRRSLPDDYIIGDKLHLSGGRSSNLRKSPRGVATMPLDDIENMTGA